MEENTKPLLLKRFISDGFDIVSLFILFILLSLLLRNTALYNTYNKHEENYMAIKEDIINNYDEKEVEEILNNNEEYQNEYFAAMLHSYILSMLIGLSCESILFLIIPMLNNGLSLGKSLTGIMLFDEKRQSKPRKFQIFIRFIFIVMTSMIIYPWTGIYTFLLIPVLRLIILLSNKKNKTLTDYISSTMYIEKLSYSSIN